MIEITPDDTPEGHDDGHAYYQCWSPRPVPLAKLIAVAVARWKIEEDHQLCKQAAGLDSGQVTTWASWHRWSAISLLVGAFLAAAAAWQRARDGDTAIFGLIPVTAPELLRRFAAPSSPGPTATTSTAKPGACGDATTTSIAPARPTNAGMPTPTGCHSRNELQLP